MAEDERAFVRETCAKVRWPRAGVTWADWITVHGPVVDAWLDSGETLVHEEDGVVLGFLVEAGGVVRCLYVKRDFRGNRFGLELCSARWPHFLVLPAYRTTASFRRWATHHGLEVVEVAQ